MQALRAESAPDYIEQLRRRPGEPELLFREALIRVRVDRTFAQFDAAILDVTIRGGQVFPVAEILIGRRLPFVFASGYGDWALPEAFRGRPRLEKPFTSDEVEAALHGLLRGADHEASAPLG